MPEDVKKTWRDSGDGETGLRLIINASPDAVLIVAMNGTVLFANPAAELLFQRGGAELLGIDFGFPVSADEQTEIEVPSKDGSVKTAEMRAVQIEWAGEEAFLVTLRDASERKKAELLKTVLTRIAGFFLSTPDEEVYGEVLRYILEVMESRFGVFGLIAERGDLFVPSMNLEVLSAWQVPDKSIVFQPHTWEGSLWERAISEKKAFYTNTPLSVPECHIPIFNFLVVPLVFADTAIGVLSVANKEGGYTEEDKNLLESIAVTIDPILNARQQKDIHERKRKQSEEALRKSENEFRQLAESMPQIVWITRPDGWNIYFNQQWVDYTGQTLEESYGNGWNKAFHPDDRERAWDAWQNAIKHCTTYSLECRLLRTDGIYKWWLVRGVPVLDDNGTVLKWFGTCTDIDDMKRSEEAFRSSEKKFRDLLETIELIAVILDCKGSIIFCNDYLLHLTGWTREEVLDRDWFDLYLPDDIREHIRLMFTSSITEGTFPVHYENMIMTHDGNKRDVVWSNSILRNVSGEFMGVASIGNDVTEHRKLEEQLRHAQKMEAVGTLAGGIAHDFNNILNVIIGYCNMLMDRLGGDPLSKEQLNEVLSAADRAANLTRRLLTFSRKQPMEIRPVDVNELILSIEKMLSRIIAEDISFALELTSRKLIILADSGQIEQVLLNLVTNARYAMKKGGKLTITTGIKEIDKEYIATYGYGKPGKYALISVADTGTGMDEEIQKKIFEPFFTTKGVGEGTGLGLSIVYGIIKQHNGYINVYSDPGRGTEFKIYLPLIDEEAIKGSAAETAAQIRGGTETILLAEDDASLRKLSRTVLEAMGYTVITAEDGEEAINKYDENKDKIRLVILDMIMPKKNGKEAYEEIRKINPEIKALFASGYTMDVISKKELLDEGMDFILKPVLPKDLVKRVREVLDR